MPKVSNFSVRINDVYTKIDVYYSKEKSFHVKNFSQDIINLSGERAVRTQGHLKESDLESAIRDIVDKYHTATATTRKVLAYKLYASTRIRMNKVGEGSYFGDRDGISESVTDIRGNADYAIGFDYMVLIEVNRNGVKYHSINDDGTIGTQTSITKHDELRSKPIILDYTPEREAAFKSLSEGMYKLMVKISDSLGDKEKAIEFIDSGVKFLS
jgi:hypothetical protein